MKQVNKAVRKKDAMSLLLGKPVYTDDLAPREALVVKLLRSPHANAEILSIDKSRALKVPGVVCVLTHEDVPKQRFTIAGQAYPEFSPYDKRILDDRVRYVGDAVAIVAGETENAVDTALRMLKVEYKVLQPVLDFHTALDNEILVHPEDDWRILAPFGGDAKRNLCAVDRAEEGDVDKRLAECEYTFEATYHTRQANQTMMETFRTFTHMDAYGRLQVVSSTQVPFHVRRILSNALGIPKSRIRVVKPRIGGGFGAKQTAVCEVYPAIVTYLTGRPAEIVYTREESFIAGSPRHEMEVRVRVGADKEGYIRALDVFTLSNTGAYGEHGASTVGLSGHKSIPLYRYARDFRFDSRVVYTNTVPAGAYRGFGATQGLFAVESAVNELAHKMGVDPVWIRELNMVREGDVMPAYYGETCTSCALDRCMARAKEMLGWESKALRRVMPDGKVRGVGVAMAMQGSGISNVDVGSATIKLTDDGVYSLLIGATDMGTGCDTILAQIAAECMECHVDDISVFGVDTDASPYDTGSYASSTTYVTGQAVVKACDELKDKLTAFAAEIMGCNSEELNFCSDRIEKAGNSAEYISLKDLAYSAMNGHMTVLEATQANTQPASPPPFMVGMAEVEVDPETGSVEIIDYVGVVDCGTAINPALAKVQTEGGLVQGIGMTLTEDIRYDDNGRLLSRSFMQYKIPSREDIGNIRVEFESSYEKSGPFGAKSIGEIVINTPAPAIADAVYNAVGVRIRELPITAEKIVMGMMK
ncbi:MAG: molybdopterin-dependent oxidoreductase [Clostridia bacterium]|nr:molybdopterin-dependent oxidoreductase [Clostridia bacterium]